jgi:hypothetical protein
VTVNVCWDFGTREIAERYVPKEGKPDQAYLADGSIFLWAEWKGEWVEDGKVGEVWEPAPPAPVELPEHLLKLPPASLLSTPGPQLTEEEMRKWHPNPNKDTGTLVGVDIYFWNDQKNVYQNHGPIADFKGFNVPSYTGDSKDLSTPPPVDDKVLQELYQADVDIGYRGTMEEWRNQNGDLNALLRRATNKCDVHPIRIEEVRALEEQRVRMRERVLLADSKEHPSLDDVTSLLESGLIKLEGEQNDVAIKALDALKKVKVDLRRKRRNTWLRWMLFWVILGTIGYGLYKWVPTQVVTGRYTVSKTCSAPFGNGTIQGMRYYNYTYKSLFGVHFTLESTVREETDVSKDGKEFTVFGLSPRNETATEEEMALADKVLKTAEVDVDAAPKPPKGKWWRINVWPSDKGTQWMKPAELYLFASEKYTTMVAYKDFCK